MTPLEDIDYFGFVCCAIRPFVSASSRPHGGTQTPAGCLSHLVLSLFYTSRGVCKASGGSHVVVHMGRLGKGLLQYSGHRDWAVMVAEVYVFQVITCAIISAGAQEAMVLAARTPYTCHRLGWD